MSGDGVLFEHLHGSCPEVSLDSVPMAHLTSITLSTRSTPAPLRAFSAPVERSVKSVPAVVGELTGWTALRINDFPPPAPRTMPDDQKRAALLAGVAAELLMPGEPLDHIEDAILLAPQSLTPAVIGREALAGLVTELVALLQADLDGCLVVTDLRHLDRDEDRQTVRRALISADFTTTEPEQMLWTLVSKPREPEVFMAKDRESVPFDDLDEPRHARIEIEVVVEYTRRDMFAAARAHAEGLGFLDPVEAEQYLNEVTVDEQAALQTLFDLDVLDDGTDCLEVRETSVFATDIRRRLPGD